MRQLKHALLVITFGTFLLCRGLACGLSLEGRVQEFDLKNGMKVLILERHVAPVASFYLRFKVGAVDEPRGETGTAHLLEHMLFKGTKTLGTRDYKQEEKLLQAMDAVAERIDREMMRGEKADQSGIAAWREQLKALQDEHRKLVIKDEISSLYEENGAEGLNASTGYDLTTYQVSLPADRMELWARIESDRMVNPVFREFYPERDVVREERRQREETQPEGMLTENFFAAAYMAHAYGRPIIGWDSDLRYLSRKRVERFFKQHYAPNNAVVAVVGAVPAAGALKIIEDYFGKIPPQEIPEMPGDEEPKQAGERRLNVEFDAYPQVLIGYHKPTMPHFDDYVFDVIDMILSSGRTSRLYKSLVEEKKIAVSVSTANGMPGSRYPNLFTIAATPRSPHTCAEVEEGIYLQLQLLQDRPVTARELDKVKNNLEADFIRALSSNAGLAAQLSYYQSIAGNWRYIENHLQVIGRITAEDVRRVAQSYLVERNRTVATLVKKETAGSKRPAH
jgi:predicted Zn-dependent peptidase